MIVLLIVLTIVTLILAKLLLPYFLGTSEIIKELQAIRKKLDELDNNG